MSDNGINLPFSSVGIDDATFGMAVFADGWKGLIITGSSQKALANNNGGRLLLHVKCAMDPTGVDTGKEHLISLNLWHNDESTKARAGAEMASIIRAIFGGDRQINNTNELYNQPFLAKAVSQLPAATQQYPNPTMQTNWRGYATKDGRGIGIDGPNGKLGAGPGAGAGGPPAFQQAAQPAAAPAQQQQAWGGAPAQTAAPVQQPAPQGGGWGAPAQTAAPAPAEGGGWGAPAAAPAQPAQNNGWGGAPAGGTAAPWG